MARAETASPRRVASPPSLSSIRVLSRVRFLASAALGTMMPAATGSNGACMFWRMYFCSCSTCLRRSERARSVRHSGRLLQREQRRRGRRLRHRSRRLVDEARAVDLGSPPARSRSRASRTCAAQQSLIICLRSVVLFERSLRPLSLGHPPSNKSTEFGARSGTRAAVNAAVSGAKRLRSEAATCNRINRINRSKLASKISKNTNVTRTQQTGVYSHT